MDRYTHVYIDCVWICSTTQPSRLADHEKKKNKKQTKVTKISLQNVQMSQADCFIYDPLFNV